MANKVIRTRYGTVINVEGLTPEQIAKVKNTAEAGGSYGGKGASLADAMRKEAAKKAKTGGGATQNTQTTQQGGQQLLQAPSNLRGQARKDWYKAHGQIDNSTPLAGTATTDAGVDVNAGAVDEDAVMAAAPQVFGAEDLQGEVKAAQDANYAYLSRDFASNKATDIENKKQELANRGIPYSDDPNSPYGKAVREIETRYSDLDMQAKNQAIAGGNETIQTLSGASIGANQAFIKNVLGLTEAELTKYGIDKDTLTKLKNIQAQKEIANKKASGGGGSGDSNVVIGGDAP